MTYRPSDEWATWPTEPLAPWQCLQVTARFLEQEAELEFSLPPLADGATLDRELPYRFASIDGDDWTTLALDAMTGRYSADAPLGRRWLPEEFYMRELGDLDANDDAALIDFAITWGPIWVEPPSSSLRDPLWDLQAVVRETLRKPGSDGSRHADDARRLPQTAPGPNWGSVHRMHLGDYREQVEDLQLLGMLVVHLQLPTSLSLWAEGRPGMSTYDAARYVERMFDLLLWPFRPRIVVPRPGREFQPNSAPIAPWGHVAALQMFNHIVEHAEVKICDNENCSREFVRHRGRAKAGQYRKTAVSYCSTECTITGSQKARRAAIRLGRELNAQGYTVKQIARNAGVNRSEDWVRRWCVPKGKPTTTTSKGDIACGNTSPDQATSRRSDGTAK